MPVLSIIACGMLEDEAAYLLSQDNELAQLVENRTFQFYIRDVELLQEDEVLLERPGTFKNTATWPFKHYNLS